MGHWYLFVFIDFHEHAMINMMVLREQYALVFGPFDVRKPFQGRGHPRVYIAKKGLFAELGRCVIAWKGATRLPEGLCYKEGNIENGFFCQ